MANQNIEEILNNMSKPEVQEMKHEEMLAKVVIKSKGKVALSFWWLCIPLYLIAAFAMKSFYVPGSTFSSTFHELTDTKSYTAIALFIVLPVALIIVNALSIKQLFYLYSSLTKSGFLETIAFELVIIILSVLMLIIYFL